MRVAVLALVALALLAAPVDARPRRLRSTTDAIADGTHWRVESAAGAIHVWTPPGYDRATAGVVIYVHGYDVDADSAWRDHDLATQFAAARVNAMFIVPEAPAGKRAAVVWPALATLLATVGRAALVVPRGPIVVVGHSGAYRTLASWIDHRRVATMILVDAMYGDPSAFATFVGRRARARVHRLVLIGADTARAGTALAKRVRGAVERSELPTAIDEFTTAERNARLLAITTALGHMELVTGGRVLPLVLAIAGLPARR